MATVFGHISYSNNSTKYLSGYFQRAISFREELMIMIVFMFRVSSSLGREKRSLVEISQFRFALHPGNWVPDVVFRVGVSLGFSRVGIEIGFRFKPCSASDYRRRSVFISFAACGFWLGLDLKYSLSP
jgi:hypothetical protein